MELFRNKMMSHIASAAIIRLDEDEASQMEVSPPRDMTVISPTGDLQHADLNLFNVDSDSGSDGEDDLDENDNRTGKKASQIASGKGGSDPEGKPGLSYIALISMAIQSGNGQKMLLSEIYQWISDHYHYYRAKDRSWRNSIRHNLSLNECFIKKERSENGKGNYWAIHQANVDDFAKGDFRRRRARRRVRQCNEQLQRLRYGNLTTPEEDSKEQIISSPNNGYVPMTSTVAPGSVLANMFGAENIFTPEEQMMQFCGNGYITVQVTSQDAAFYDGTTMTSSVYPAYNTPANSPQSCRSTPMNSCQYSSGSGLTYGQST